MDRLGATGFILNDLRRGRLGYVAAWLAGPRYDPQPPDPQRRAAVGPASLHPGRTGRSLCDGAGVEDAVISTHLWFRMAAVKHGRARRCAEARRRGDRRGRRPGRQHARGGAGQARPARDLCSTRRVSPRHKACSEYVNAGGVQLLDEMGVLDEVDGGRARTGWTRCVVHAPDGHRFTADFGRAEPGRAALGLSRYCLDHLLLDRAQGRRRRRSRAGPRPRRHSRRRACRRCRGDDRRRIATRLRAPLVIGADGRHSVVARSLGLEPALRWPRKTGLAAHYRDVRRLSARSARCTSAAMDLRRPRPARAWHGQRRRSCVPRSSTLSSAPARSRCSSPTRFGRLPSTSRQTRRRRAGRRHPRGRIDGRTARGVRPATASC